MAAKASSPSCLSLLKDTLLLPTKNAKLFAPILLLFAIPTFLLQIIRINERNNPSNDDFEKVVREILQEEMGLVIIAVSVIIIIIFFVIAFVYGFMTQTIALFAASTTYSGDRYSLPELFSKVVMKGRHLRGPLMTMVMVGVLKITWEVLLEALLQLVMPHFGVPYTEVALYVFEFLVFLYLDVVFVVAIAVSVVDTECRGVSALRQAWRLMTRVWRMGGLVLVVVVNVLLMVRSPVYTLALGYSMKSMPMELSMLSLYALLSALVQLFYFAAATVYYYQAMEIKEVVAQDYVKIPTGDESAV